MNDYTNYTMVDIKKLVSDKKFRRSRLLGFLSIFLLIYDVDIGHQQPNLTILNGSLAEFSVDETWSGSLVTQLI